MKNYLWIFCVITIAYPAFADGSGGSKHDAVKQRCGNGVREGTEECDDGNTTANDGCSAICKIEIIAPSSGPMKVKKLEAERIDTKHIETGTMNVDTANFGNVRVARLTVEDSEHYPLHQFGILGNYATSIGSPYSLQMRLKYAVMWRVDTKGTILGLSAEAGVGFWNWYTTEKSVQPMIQLFAAFQVGNDIGGFAIGPEMWMLAPLDGHCEDEHWELMTMIRVGGWINLPGQHNSNAFVLQPWIGIPVYQPRNPSSPHFNNPAFLMGISFGWGHTFNPLP